MKIVFDEESRLYVQRWGTHYISVYSVDPRTTFDLPTDSHFRVATLDIAEKGTWYAVTFTVKRGIPTFGAVRDRVMVMFVASEREPLAEEKIELLNAVVARSQIATDVDEKLTLCVVR